MAARAFVVSTDVISLAAFVVLGNPLAMFVKFRMLSPFDGLSHTLTGTYQALAFDGFRIDIGPTRFVTAISRASGVAQSITPTHTVDDYGWHHCLARFTSTTSRDVRLDNGPVSIPNTNSNTPGTLAKVVVGARDASGTLSQNIGHIVDRVIYFNQADISDEEYFKLVAGNYDVRRHHQVVNLSFVDGVPRDEFSLAWTMTGTSLADAMEDRPAWLDMPGFEVVGGGSSFRPMLVNQAVNRAATY